MNIEEARELGDQIGALVGDRKLKEACDLLYPVLAERTPFRLLDVIGLRLCSAPWDAVHIFLDQVAS